MGQKIRGFFLLIIKLLVSLQKKIYNESQS
nr:MAG TPA: hypothetical protein [Bacteriophage sp.]